MYGVTSCALLTDSVQPSALGSRDRNNDLDSANDSGLPFSLSQGFSVSVRRTVVGYTCSPQFLPQCGHWATVSVVPGLKYEYFCYNRAPNTAFINPTKEILILQLSASQRVVRDDLESEKFCHMNRCDFTQILLAGDNKISGWVVYYNTWMEITATLLHVRELFFPLYWEDIESCIFTCWICQHYGPQPRLQKHRKPERLTWNCPVRQGLSPGWNQGLTLLI